MALVTAANVRAQIPHLTGTAQDTFLDSLIAAAEEAIAAWLGYSPIAGVSSAESVTYTEYVPTHRVLGNRVVLSNTPVTGVTSVHDDPDWGYGSDTLVDSSNYTLDSEEGVVWLKPDNNWGSFSKSDRAIKVVYTAGYSSAPDALKQAVILLVKEAFVKREAPGVSNLSMSGKSVGFTGGWGMSERPTINKQVQGMIAHLRCRGAVEVVGG